MLIVIGENKETIEGEAVKFDVFVDSIETLYLEFENLKRMTGSDNLVLVKPNYIELMARFPFDLVFLTGCPHSENPATYLASTEFKTVDWTSYMGHLSVRSKNDNFTIAEEYSDTDE